MNVILLILYFTTPAAPGAKVESKKVWTLQSTSQMEFHSSEACHRIGKQLIAYVQPVATMTVRAYCLCEAGTGTVCPTDTEHLVGPDVKPVPTVEPLGPSN
jgi:hypothetical protein